MANTFTHVLLDLDGTVLDFLASQEVALAATAKRLGVAAGPLLRRVYGSINEGLWRAYERGEIEPDGLRLTRWERVLEVLGVDADPREISERYLEDFAANVAWMPRAEQAVRDLAATHTLAVVTNGFGDVQRRRVATSGIADLIEVLVVSDESGASKPDPAIFDVAFAALGHPPRDKVMMVGDSLSADIAGGNAYGMATTWLTGERAVPSTDPLQTPTYTIASLDQLPALLA